MISITDGAASILHETLESRSDNASEMFRLVETEEGIGIDLGEEGVQDQVIEHGDRKILAVDASLAETLDGATLDVQDTPEGKHLVLTGIEEGA